MNTSYNVLAALFIGYISYFFIIWYFKIKSAHNLTDVLFDNRKLSSVNFKHFTGILLLTLPVYFFYNKFYFLVINKIQFSKPVFFAGWIFLLVITGFISLLEAKKHQNKHLSKDFTQLSLTKSLTYLSIRIPFLFCYELFFRGILLFSLVNLVGIYLAIIINIIFYVIIHLFDSRNEIIGCIPFGIILCILSYSTNSVWPAFILHATLSCVYELKLLFNNPPKSIEI
ncbi:MAG: CPBP family intramembrane glutamic endopeptidase [Daejeonella sp.]